MANIVPTVNIKCRVSVRDDDRPRKEVTQRHDIFEFTVPPLDDDEWQFRLFIASMVMLYGID